jgi:predicted SAM-dependent methyltransferase
MKINVGSGKIRIDGYKNLDMDPRNEPEYVGKAEELPFEDGTVDVIYASHILEHILPDIDVIKEWHRVLKVGGELFVAVPDIDQCIALHHAGIMDRMHLQASVFGAYTVVEAMDEAFQRHYRIYTPSIVIGELGRYFKHIVLKPDDFPRDLYVGEVHVKGIKE